ncbi:hypothetical protein BD408DRAFT_478557 [Parasitella parasitica]|nr:hypothetical protein BD408DRAFT_478557 [Parasitella parasitica]
MLASDFNTNKLRPRLKVVSTTTYSQSTPTAHLYQQDHADPPYSPTESSTSFISSISGIAEKSALELGSLLRNAYKSLREKEKNLLLAAEIGKSLLEHNQSLKSDYDKLLQNAKNCQFETRNDQEYENTMRLISSKKAYDTIIESLERKNQDLEQMLEQTQHNSELTIQNNLQKQRKLEAEIEILQNNLDIAAQKVVELEDSRQYQQERARQLDEKRDFQQRQTEDLELLHELTVKMEELCIENKHLQLSKKAVEEKLIISLRDLDSLRHDFENFELTNQCYEQLQEAFERQSAHIKELNNSLEDHRLVLSRLRDKGVWSPEQSNAPSVSAGPNSVISATCVSKQSLMGELENAWSKNCLIKSKSDTNLSSLSNKLFDLANLTERNLTSFYTAPADYALDTILSTMGIDDRSTLDEAEQFLASNCSDELFGPEGNINIYKEVDLYPSYRSLPTLSATANTTQYKDQPKGLINHIMFQIRYLFHSIFRWCRFAIILTTAIFINLWKGPDLLLEKQYC